MKTLQIMYEWCRIKCTRVLGAIALILPKSANSARIKIVWLGKRTKMTLLSALRIISMMLFLCPGIIRIGGGSTPTGFPSYTYSGVSAFVDDGNGNWHIDFLTSGTLRFSRRCTLIDVFVVGGGGGGHAGRATSYAGCAGGGGYTTNVSGQTFSANVDYTVIIGAGGVAATGDSTAGSGGTTSISGTDISISAAGGHGGENTLVGPHYNGGDGGSGGGAWEGVGGTNGGNGASDGLNPIYGHGGYGQGTTTREFAHPSLRLFSTGGNAGRSSPALKSVNTGNGGDGGAATNSVAGTAGGSGIIVIRNQRAA